MTRMIYIKDSKAHINIEDINTITENGENFAIHMKSGKVYNCTRIEADYACGRGVIKEMIPLKDRIIFERKSSKETVNVTSDFLALDYSGGLYYLILDDISKQPVLVPISGNAANRNCRNPELVPVLPMMSKVVYTRKE